MVICIVRFRPHPYLSSEKGKREKHHKKKLDYNVKPI